mmetsp:Transcript_30334/g.75918  ORF Transcript_30334/g.75918 Transcript_30334/m.75918 type:complete len:246 (+) Transcript_30334:1420-2157(+)
MVTAGVKVTCPVCPSARHSGPLYWFAFHNVGGPSRLSLPSSREYEDNQASAFLNIFALYRYACVLTRSQFQPVMSALKALAPSNISCTVPIDAVFHWLISALNTLLSPNIFHMTSTFPVSQLPILPPMKASALWNIQPMSTTFPVSQEPRSPANSVAELNMSRMLVTFAVFQRETSPVKAAAPLNTLFIEVTLMVFHLLTSPLKSALFLKSPSRSVIWDTSQSPISPQNNLSPQINLHPIPDGGF